MPPRLQLFASRSVVLRTKSRVVQGSAPALHHRYASDKAKDLPIAGTPKGPNQEQLPHVSEEAAAMAEVTGETAPDIEAHGTPVQEVSLGGIGRQRSY